MAHDNNSSPDLKGQGRCLMALVNRRTADRVAALPIAGYDAACRSLLHSTQLQVLALQARRKHDRNHHNSDALAANEEELLAVARSSLDGSGISDMCRQCGCEDPRTLCQLVVFVSMWGTTRPVFTELPNSSTHVVELCERPEPWSSDASTAPCSAALSIADLTPFSVMRGAFLHVDVCEARTTPHGLREMMCRDAAGALVLVEIRCPLPKYWHLRLSASCSVRVLHPEATINSAGSLVVLIDNVCQMELQIAADDCKRSPDILEFGKESGDFHLADDNPCAAMHEYAFVLRRSREPRVALAVTLLANAAQCALNLGRTCDALVLSAAAMFFDSTHAKARQRYQQALHSLRALHGGKFEILDFIRTLQQSAWPFESLAPENIQQKTAAQLNDAAKPMFVKRQFTEAFGCYIAALRCVDPLLHRLVSNVARCALDLDLSSVAAVASLLVPMLEPASADASTGRSSIAVKALKRFFVALAAHQPTSSDATLSAWKSFLESRGLDVSGSQRHDTEFSMVWKRVQHWQSATSLVQPQRLQDPALGRGMIALQSIPARTVVLCERPVSVTTTDSVKKSLVTLQRATRVIPPMQAALAWATFARCAHGFSGFANALVSALTGDDCTTGDVRSVGLPPPPPTLEEWWRRNPLCVDDPQRSSVFPTLDRVADIVECNAFETSPMLESTAFEAGLYPRAAMLNSAELPNATRRFSLINGTPAMLITVWRDIEPGEEITHRYYPLDYVLDPLREDCGAIRVGRARPAWAPPTLCRVDELPGDLPSVVPQILHASTGVGTETLLSHIRGAVQSILQSALEPVLKCALAQELLTCAIHAKRLADVESVLQLFHDGGLRWLVDDVVVDKLYELLPAADIPESSFPFANALLTSARL